jgi:hypothetical protein
VFSSSFKRKNPPQWFLFLLFVIVINPPTLPPLRLLFVCHNDNFRELFLNNHFNFTIAICCERLIQLARLFQLDAIVFISLIIFQLVRVGLKLFLIPREKWQLPQE